MLTAPKEYHWKHLPSNKEGVAEFVEAHAREVGAVLLHPSGRLALSDAHKLLAKWNTAPDWKYWL